jgi:hypothetical protein
MKDYQHKMKVLLFSARFVVAPAVCHICGTRPVLRHLAEAGTPAAFGRWRCAYLGDTHMLKVLTVPLELPFVAADPADQVE